jgi:hypothetical protein
VLYIGDATGEAGEYLGRETFTHAYSLSKKQALTRFLFVLVVIAVTAAILVPVAFAASWSASATTVCTGGYSSLYWAGYNVWDWGRTTAWLWTYSEARGN